MFFTSIFKRFFKNRKGSSSKKKSISTLESEQITTNTSSKEGANFQFREGRRYQNEALVSYVLPNDYDGIIVAILDKTHTNLVQ